MAPDGRPNSQGTGWNVTSQQETTDLDPQGRAVRGVRVMFTTDKGIHASVFLPASMYNPANVKAAIMGYVQQLHEVADLRA